jgi:GTP-binding protein HflX
MIRAGNLFHRRSGRAAASPRSTEDIRDMTQQNTDTGTGRAFVLHPVLPSAAVGSGASRSPDARLAEAIELAQAIDLQIAGAELVRVAKPNPATLLGKGAVAGIAAVVSDRGVDVAVVDAAITPAQQRNLERAWRCKVIDRTGLILEIFGERARTREGQLQVELAALTYQRSRLVRSWTHLGRQRGGFGFLGGPGETQLETDRRLISERMTRLKEELEEVRRTRGLQRGARRRAAQPVVALVGYTNAGKSTLFNRLTHADVYAEDQLFATLDPTLRAIELPSGRRVVLSDTVGFISELPTQLVAAFRATLEEVTEADLIIHVRDIHHPDSEAQRQDVLHVLRELGVDTASGTHIVEALNKIDLLPPAERGALLTQSDRAGTVAISAKSGEGIDHLLRAVERRLDEGTETVEVDVPAEDGAEVAWLYSHGEVLERQDKDRAVHIRVKLPRADAARLRARLSAALPA